MERPNYYAVVPAEVRYDPDLRPNEKLLFAEITALATKEGYCWATNSYFAALFGVSTRVITTWISHLKGKGYIKVDTIRNENRVLERKIYVGMELNFQGYGIKVPGGTEQKFQGGMEQNFEGGTEQKFQENNTSINNTSISNTSNKREINKEKYGEFGNVLLSDEEIGKLKQRFPSSWERWIARLDEYIESKGAKYKNHYATILNWARRDDGKDNKEHTVLGVIHY